MAFSSMRLPYRFRPARDVVLPGGFLAACFFVFFGRVFLVFFGVVFLALFGSAFFAFLAAFFSFGVMAGFFLASFLLLCSLLTILFLCFCQVKQKKGKTYRSRPFQASTPGECEAGPQ